PALLAGALFALLHRVHWVRHPWCRTGLIAVSVLTWTLSLLFSIVLIATNRWTEVKILDAAPALRVTFHPLCLAAAGLFALFIARTERRLDHAPEFPLGLLVGVLAVLATTALNAAVLLWGGEEDWHILVLLVFVAHLPIAVIEGVVLGFTVGFLARVKPEMLAGPEAADRWQAPAPVTGIMRPAAEVTAAPPAT